MKPARFLPIAAALALLATPLLAQPAGDKPKPDDKSSDPRIAVYPEAPSVTHHTITVDGEPIHYTATAAVLTLTDRESKPTANIFYVSYRRTLESNEDFEKKLAAWKDAGSTGEPPTNFPDPATRPLTFSFNGGPGSSSVWLHLGIFGPKRVDYADDKGNPGPPPYGVVDNHQTMLDVSDFVFIDPVSTGYSRAEQGTSEKDFHGVESDIASVAEFIRRFMTTEQRWRSPRFVAGESYGTTRAAGLAEYLHERHGVSLNGVILISAALQFGAIRFDTGNDLPFIVFLPTYAATAYYHQRAAPEQLAKPLPQFLEEVEAFAIGEYAAALAQGTNLDPQTADQVIAKMAAYTGLSEDYLRRTRMRVEIARFAKELLRDEDLTVGRFDSRFTGIDRDGAGENYDFDPSYAVVRSNFTESFNAYVREELGFESDLSYEILTNVWPWSFSPAGDNQYLDVAERLRSAMHQQPHLQVLLASGYFDMATPHFASDYVMSHMGLAPSLLQNLTTRYYAGGHMMYVDREARAILKQDLDAFYAQVLDAARTGAAPAR